MGQNPEELSTTPADIAATRSNLSRDVDELSDKVSPHRVMERRKEAARGRLTSLKDKMMGTASDARHSAASAGGSMGDSASEAAGSVKGGAHHAVDTVESKTEGNPLAAGLVAFGAGMLISALIPASEKEAEAAGRVVDAAKEHGQPVLDEAKSVGSEMGSDLKESATEAAQEVKSTAQDAAGNVKGEGQSSAQTVKQEAKPS
jgi:gas vesicle protein